MLRVRVMFSVLCFLHANKNDSRSRTKQLCHGNVIIMGPSSQDINGDVVLLNIYSLGLLLKSPSKRTLVFFLSPFDLLSIHGVQLLSAAFTILQLVLVVDKPCINTISPYMAVFSVDWNIQNALASSES